MELVGQESAGGMDKCTLKVGLFVEMIFLLADIYGAWEIEQSFVIVAALLSFYLICKSFNVLKSY